MRCAESTIIRPGETVAIPLGVTLEILGDNTFVQLSARSSTALMGVYCHIGTIDASFNGKELKAILTNIGNDAVIFNQYERVVQAIVLDHGSMVKSEEAIDSGDSKEGFGSSGRM